MNAPWAGYIEIADFSVRPTAGGKLDQRANQLGRLISEDIIRLGGQ